MESEKVKCPNCEGTGIDRIFLSSGNLLDMLTLHASKANSSSIFGNDPRCRECNGKGKICLKK